MMLHYCGRWQLHLDFATLHVPCPHRSCTCSCHHHHHSPIYPNTIRHNNNPPLPSPHIIRPSPLSTSSKSHPHTPTPTMPPLKRSRSPSASPNSHRPPNSPSPTDAKMVHLDKSSPEIAAGAGGASAGAGGGAAMVMQCALAPHAPLSFASYAAYEVHYQQTHTNRCSECGRNFPDEHFLGLHIAENHDPIRAAKEARGEYTVGCCPSQAFYHPFDFLFFSSLR